MRRGRDLDQLYHFDHTHRFRALFVVTTAEEKDRLQLPPNDSGAAILLATYDRLRGVRRGTRGSHT